MAVICEGFELKKSFLYQNDDDFKEVEDLFLQKQQNPTSQALRIFECIFGPFFSKSTLALYKKTTLVRDIRFALKEATHRRLLK